MGFRKDYWHTHTHKLFFAILKSKYWEHGKIAMNMIKDFEFNILPCLIFAVGWFQYISYFNICLNLLYVHEDSRVQSIYICLQFSLKTEHTLINVHLWGQNKCVLAWPQVLLCLLIIVNHWIFLDELEKWQHPDVFISIMQPKCIKVWELQAIHCRASFIKLAFAQNVAENMRTPVPAQKVGFIKKNLTWKYAHLHANSDPCVRTFWRQSSLATLMVSWGTDCG